ncbi:MAG: M28 family metallopeptidase [Thermoanaerobaculales bacterium]|nr:M28 family metallopeptidase [Thermoanaerobaculales bacterium]
MTDGNLIFDDAAALAFPRYPGTEGDAKAISLLESRFQETGLETTLQWFTYDLAPAQRALRVVLMASAMLVAVAGFVMTSSPLSGLILLVAAFLPGAVFLSWAPWLEKLYRREGGTRTANVVGRRCVTQARMTVMLMAHHDSKSQSLSFPFRMGLTIISVAGTLLLASLAVVAILSGSLPGPTWLAPAAGGATAVAALVLSAMKSGNRSPGGVDNAGSVAIILAAAKRLIDELPDDIELVVLSTGAEEDHMIGAMRWLDVHADSLVPPAYCLNFDGAGAPGRAVLIERYGFGKLFSSQISAAARRAADLLGIKPRGIVMLPGMGIDSIPFAHRGVPCLTLASGSLGRATMSVHSANDKAEHLDPDTLAEIADLAHETIMELSRA